MRPTAPQTRVDHVVGDSARLLARWIYSSVEVRRTEPEPGGPVLALVNHGAGFSDPVVAIVASARMPRFVARDLIWRVPVAASVMRAIQAIPIHRRQDGPAGAVDNRSSFAEVTAALGEGQLVTIFPEGDSIDAPQVHRLRTGAARMSLEARRAGVGGLRILPMGLHFRDKGALRSAVLVEVGPSIDFDQLVDSLGGIPEDEEAQHALVRSLTERFGAALTAVSPEFQDWDEVRDLEDAAAIALRTYDDRRGGPAPVATYGNEAQLADLLEDAGSDAVLSVRAALRTYADDLAVLGLTDADIAGRRSLRGRLATRALQLAVALPAAVAALPANAPGLLVVAAAGRLPIAPPTMATVKPMAAMVAFPAGWAWFSLHGGRRGPGRVVGRYLVAQAGLVATFVVADRSLALLRAGRGAIASRRLPGDQVRAHRDAVVAAVRSAAEEGWAARPRP